MIDILNIAAALITIAIGLFGLVAPRYTAGVLDLKTGATNMGLSELRASAGGMFVSLGAACLILGTDWAYAMLGIAYLGAGTGRLVSLIADAPPRKKAGGYFAFEAIFAAWLIGANMAL
ncbi:DUF4345 family protein [Roseivivax sp. CAU 1761]